jgi:two-component system, OmpR family, response regulator
MAKNSKRVRIFSALEVANICGVVNQTTINWIKSGHLQAFITPGGQYRIYAEDLINFLHTRGMRVPDELLENEFISVDWSSIIIVDDDTSLNNLIKMRLSKKMPGYKILQAFDGFEAGQLLTEKKPGVIILDINLPGIDGYKICNKIRTDAAMSDSVIIAITGLEDPGIEMRILEQGADACFSKPINFNHLISSIRENLKKHQQKT